MTEVLLERSSQLINHRRFKDAEQQIKEILSTDPLHADALVLLAICKSETGQREEALQLIKQVVSLKPDSDYYLYLHSLFLLQNDNAQQAEKFIKSAISINPEVANYFGLLAQIKLQQKEWRSALEAADKGLELDSENLDCLNLRSTALLKLNRPLESFVTIQEALNQDPENDNTHANVGWSHLENNDHKKALEHFREALKLNPSNAYAKAGLVEGLKARYIAYRFFLKYAFWVSNMKGKYQWALILGMFFGIRILKGIAISNPELSIVITPIVYLYMAFAISTWLIEPISNLFLRLNVYGRYALTPEEIKSSNFVGIFFGLAIVSGILALLQPGELFLVVMIYGLIMMILLSAMFKPQKPSNKKILIVSTIGLGVIGLFSIILDSLYLGGFNLWLIFLVGAFIYQWVANAMIIR